MSKHHLLLTTAALRAMPVICLAALPFELTAGIALGPLTLTNVELLLVTTLGLWVGLLLIERRGPDVPLWLAIGAAALVGALLLGAAFATAERAGALKFALRQAQGALLALCLADAARRGEGGGLFASALLAGAALSAALGLGEMSEAPAALALLAPFKTESTYMGGLIRLSETFSSANTAAQYYEALLPLAVLVAAHGLRLGQPAIPTQAGWGSYTGFPSGARRSLAAALRWLLPSVLLFATLFTYSRAALAVTAVLLVVTPAAAWLLWGGLSGRRVAAVAGGLAGLALTLMAASPVMRVRIAEPDITTWYSAAYVAPPLAPMAPNELRSVTLTVRNSGRVQWDHTGLRPVRLAYHWLDAETGRVVRFEGRRTLLPHPVAPGTTLTLAASVQAPAAPGRYVLAWDMVREYIGRGWFSQMGVPLGRVVVEVGGAPARVEQPPPERTVSPLLLERQPGPPGRRELWGAALAFWQERPLLGIGPDVFRHVYGPRLGREPFDNRIHTNNLYLELLTGAGLVGLGAFVGLAGAALTAGLRRLRTSAAFVPQQSAPPSAANSAIVLLGALLGLIAFLCHGLLDVFLAFTPTYALLWVLLGITAGLARPTA